MYTLIDKFGEIGFEYFAANLSVPRAHLERHQGGNNMRPLKAGNNREDFLWKTTVSQDVDIRDRHTARSRQLNIRRNPEKQRQGDIVTAADVAAFDILSLER